MPYELLPNISNIRKYLNDLNMSVLILIDHTMYATYFLTDSLLNGINLILVPEHFLK